jgi:hypothetical protein
MLFVRGKNGEILEIPYADLRRPFRFGNTRRYLRRLGRDSITIEDGVGKCGGADVTRASFESEAD